MRRLIIDVKLGADGWWHAIMRGYERDFASTACSKTEALDFAVNEARAHRDAGGIAQVVIRSRLGRIQSERTYGSDPRRRRG